MTDKNKTATTGNSDGTVLKAFIINDGRFIIEVAATNLENIMFSIRGVIDSKSLPEMFQTAEAFFKKIINDSKRSTCKMQVIEDKLKELLAKVDISSVDSACPDNKDECPISGGCTECWMKYFKGE